LLARQVQSREQSFLRIVERGVYGNPGSPYRRLLEHAGVAFDDVSTLVREIGLEGALARLYEAGVYVSHEEFKGRLPIRRGALEFSAQPQDFDNPLLVAHYTGQSSGTSGAGSRVVIDLDSVAHDAAYVSCLLEAHAVAGRPIAVWRPAPPSSDGLNGVLRYMKLGWTPERWFSSRRFDWRAETFRSNLFMASTLLASRAFGRPVPRPEFVPREQAVTVTRWLADKKARGVPGFLDSSASAAVRVCLEAMENDLDISGTVFRVGGEPFTSAKATVIAEAGARAIPHCGMAELGTIGLGCAEPSAIDDLHLFTDKIAVIQRDKRDRHGTSIPALVYSTVLPHCPKLMLNTESGDYGSLEVRECGCAFGSVGLTTHLTEIRSYEKLTSEGVTFLEGDLYRLVEEELPARFGGGPTDYQIVEDDTGGVAKVKVVVAPRVGEVDEGKVVEAVLRALREYPLGGPVMADQWRQGQTLSVVRREPYTSGGRKVFPLHVLRLPEQS
jgi:hypothetical protein